MKTYYNNLFKGFCIAFCFFSTIQLQAQNNVGIGTNTPDKTALLDLQARQELDQLDQPVQEYKDQRDRQGLQELGQRDQPEQEFKGQQDLQELGQQGRQVTREQLVQQV